MTSLPFLLGGLEGGGKQSALTGDPVKDIVVVLKELSAHISEQD